MNFRWGILGTGYVARKFVLGLRESEGAVATVVASRTPENAARFAAGLNISTAARTYEEAVASAQVDAFYVATPPADHARLALMCIAAGKPVLVEKPFAMTGEEAEAIAQAASAAGVFCMEGMWTRFLPLVRQAKARVAGGDLGEILSVAGSFGTRADETDTPNLFDPALGGGALMHRGVYALSLASHFAGGISGVTSQARLGASGVDEDVMVVARHERGALSNSYASLRGQASNDLIVVGSKKTLHIRTPIYMPYHMELQPAPAPGKTGGGGGRMEALREGGLLQGLNQRLSGIARRRKAVVETAYYAGNGYHYEADEVARCIRAGKAESDVMPLAESVAIMRLMDQAKTQWR